jgi:hypothetical protein
MKSKTSYGHGLAFLKIGSRSRIGLDLLGTSQVMMREREGKTNKQKKGDKNEMQVL